MSENGAETLPKQDELYCFLDKERPCQADCMAFMTVAADNRQLDGGQAHCVLLDGVTKLNVLAAIGGAMVKDQRQRDADSRRAAAGSPMPPNPLGGR
jgi:hypothetical protein